jgi:hypothetical protein
MPRPLRQLRDLDPRRAGTPVWLLPALAAVLTAGLWLLFAPPTPDLAAQVYRTGLYREHGFTVFNAQWYGGHHTPGYSILFPPLAAALGPRVVGALAAVASAALFAVLAGRHFGHRARFGALWFGVATATDLFIGRLTFGLGVAFALAALLALQRGRPRAAVALGMGTTLASPVAGLFLAMACGALWLAHRDRTDGLWVAAGAFAPAAALSIAFPEGGVQPWGGTSFLVLLALTALVLWLLPRAERALRTGTLVYGLAAIAAFAIASPMGSNATRLGALFAGPLLLCALWGARERVPRLPGARSGVLVGGAAAALLVWQWYAPVRETAKGLVDPSSQAAFYEPLIDQIQSRQPRAGAATRVEIPFTRMHWESVHVARRLQLARGWETQLDVKYNPLFRKGRELTAERYQHWLQANGVRYVALPAVPLDPAAHQEARIIRRGLPYLTRVWADRHWQLFAVEDARGLAGRDARLRRIGPSSFTLEARRRGRHLVRVRWTPYWRLTSGQGCVERGPEGWTTVDAARPGVVRIAARFDPERIVRRGPRCRSG